MKNLTSLFILLFISAATFSQDLVTKKKPLFGKLTEEYEVLKTDRKTRNGACKIYNGSTLAGTGKYTDGKRVGRWLFYDRDSIQQVYNYDTRKLQYDRPPSGVSFQFDFRPGDTVSKPAIMEGSLGRSKLLHGFFPIEMASHEGTFQIVHYISISESGEVTNWDYKIISPGWNSGGTRNLAGVERELLTAFVPATVNKQPVKSTIIMSTTATNTKTLERMIEVRTPVSTRQVISTTRQ